MMKTGIMVFMFSIMISAVFAQTTTESADLSDVSALSLSLVNQDPDPAIAGDIVEVRIGVENLGGSAATNIMVELVAEYPFDIATGEEAIQKIGTINAYQGEDNMRIVKYRITVNRDATAGSYTLKVNYYEEGSNVKTQSSLSIDIQNRENAEVIYIDKTVLIPGEQSGLKFTINNVGNAPLRDLTFYWENEDGIILPVGSDNTKYIKYIDIGESADLQYQVIADTNADPGLYKLDLYLTYDDPLSDEEKEIATIAGMYVGGGTDFDVAFSDSTSGETSFSIANIGSNPAYSVSVIIPKQDGWKVSGSSSVIIGNLNKGDYTVASFTLQSTTIFSSAGDDRGTDNAQEKIQQRTPPSPVKMQIAYTDTRGERKTVDKEVQVNLQSVVGTDGTTKMPGVRRPMEQESFFSKYKWYIIALVVLVVGLSFRSRYKKRRLADPNYKMFGKKKK